MDKRSDGESGDVAENSLNDGDEVYGGGESSVRWESCARGNREIKLDVARGWIKEDRVKKSHGDNEDSGRISQSFTKICVRPGA